MTMLGQILPGVQLYLLLIAGLLTFFYLRRIKDPESDLKDIFSFVLVIGGISLLVFGNLMVLILIIGLFAGGYLMIHHWMKQSEHTPVAAVQTLQQLHPDVAKKIADLESGMQTLTAKEAKTASEERRIAHDFGVIESDVATIAAINEKAAKDIAKLSLEQMSAEEREEAILKVWQEHGARMEKELGQTYSVSGTEQQARFRLNQSIQFVEQEAKELAGNEEQILQDSLREANDLIAMTHLVEETARRAEQLTAVIADCANHLPDNLGKQTLAHIKKERKETNEQLRAAENAKQADVVAALTQVKTSLEEWDEQAQTAVSSLQNEIKRIQKNLTDAKPLLKKMNAASITPAHKKLVASIGALYPIQAELDQRFKELTAKTTEAMQSKEEPGTFGGSLINLTDAFFKTLIKSREKRMEMNTSLLALLTAFADTLSNEAVVSGEIEEAGKAFENAEILLETLNKIGDKASARPEIGALDASKAALATLDSDAFQARTQEINTALQTVSTAQTTLKQNGTKSQQLLKNARSAQQTIVDSLKRAFMGMMNTQAKIINFKAESLKRQNEATFGTPRKAA